VLTCSIDLTEFRTCAAGSRRVLGQYTNRAVRSGLEVGAKFAQTHYEHTRQTGYLTSRDAIQTRIVSSNDSSTEGDLLNVAKYAPFVEYGTKPHRIEPIDYWGGPKPIHRVGARAGKRVLSPTSGAGRGQFLRFMIGGRVIFARFVNHPGSPPMPFMHPAAEVAGLEIMRFTSQVTFPAVASIWT
jgi:hypothetical protein